MTDEDKFKGPFKVIENKDYEKNKAHEEQREKEIMELRALKHAEGMSHFEMFFERVKKDPCVLKKFMLDLFNQQDRLEYLLRDNQRVWNLTIFKWFNKVFKKDVITSKQELFDLERKKLIKETAELKKSMKV